MKAICSYTVCNYKKKVKFKPNKLSFRKCVASKKSIVKKDVKFKVVAKKWL